MITKKNNIMIKRVFFVCLIAILGVTSVYAQSGKCGEKLQWTYDESSRTLNITGSGRMYDYEYNSSTHKYTMPWEALVDQIEKVSLPNGLTYIGSHSFYNFKNLKSVNIPNTVLKIGSWAFSGCISIVDLSVPSSVAEMESGSFWDVPNIKYYGSAYGAPRDARCQNGYVDGYLVYSDASKTVLKACSFQAKGAITIPNTVKTIDTKAFSGCSNLTSITIPDGVTSIGSFCFSGCRSLTTLSIPASVKVINDHAFYYCGKLQNLYIAGSNVEIGNESLGGCDKLLYIYCQNGIDLSMAKVPAITQRMPYEAPSNSQNDYASSSTSENIKGKVIKSGKCGENVKWQLSDLGELLIFGSGPMTEYSNYKEPYSPWQKNKDLKKVVISNGVTSIGGFSFYYCSNLREVIIPNSVTIIGGHAFYSCSSLTTIQLPNFLNEIGNNAFWYCSFSSINIPKTVTEIGSGAFCGCSNLQSVEIPSGITEIGYMTFDECRSLTSIVIPNHVRSVGSDAFESCTSLKEIYYPKGLDLSKANIPSNVRQISYDSSNLPKVLSTNIHEDRPALIASQPTTISKSKVSSTPPNLIVVDGSVNFVDKSGNNQIDASEQCSIRFKVRNIGKGSAENCVATIRMEGNTTGITTKNVTLPSIEVNATKDVEIPISSSIQTVNGQVNFTIEVTEPNGFGTDPFELSVNTKEYDQPFLQIVDYTVTGIVGGTLTKKQPFNLQLMMQNTKYGKAENVEIELQLPANVFLLEGDEVVKMASLEGGKAQSLDYQLVVTNNYNETNIPIEVRIKERYGKYAENKTVVLQLNQTMASTRLTVKAVEADLARQEIKLATIGSAVDKNIPVTNVKNDHTFVVIIANENYKKVSNVPFALNDGNIFKQYCEKTLGIPSTNIHFAPDATGNDIRHEVNWLNQVLRAYNGDAKIIFYYAGHGVPDEQSKTAYLLPIDGIGSDITTGYKLDDLYGVLGQLPSQSVTVFLDACFSGSKREEGMLTSARGIAIKVKGGQPIGKMVVFSAATGDETAYPNKKECHGMFTYYLLKSLQETKGDVTYEELGAYIRQNVSQQSIVINGKSQTPTIIPSAEASSWQTWKLK